MFTCNTLLMIVGAVLLYYHLGAGKETFVNSFEDNEHGRLVKYTRCMCRPENLDESECPDGFRTTNKTRYRCASDCLTGKSGYKLQCERI